MERKDYAQKFHDIKNEILKEIRELIPEDTAHRFNEKFYVHFIEGEVATTEVCTAVEVWHGGMVVFIVNPQTGLKEEVIEGETVFQYDAESFMDILDHLRKEVREKKLAQLQEIVKKHNGKLSFDGFFEFVCDDTEDNSKANLSHSDLVGLELKDDGKLYVLTRWHEDGEQYGYNQDCIIDEEIDRMLDYVQHVCKKKFRIRAYETFSRIFEVEAFNYEEAVELARKELEESPFEKGDSDGLCFD